MGVVPKGAWSSLLWSCPTGVSQKVGNYGCLPTCTTRLSVSKAGYMLFTSHAWCQIKEYNASFYPVYR